MDLENIIYEKDDGIARIIINRPAKRNALNRVTRLEMASALEDTRMDSSVKALVISGAGGKSFISGSDLTELSTFTPLELEEVVISMARSIAEKSSLALKWAKKSINTGQETTLSMGLAYEALAECLLFSGKDREEGMKAFFEKRKPHFEGK